MAVSTYSELHTSTTTDIDLDATAETIVVAAAGNKTLFALTLDNRNNTTISYAKIWNSAASAPTVGTDDPDYVIPVPSGVRLSIMANAGHGVVQVCATNGWYTAGVVTAGTPGTTSPTNAFKAVLKTS